MYNKKSLMPMLRDYILIIFGILLYAIGFCVFVMPHHIVIGGMTGFATLVYYATGGFMPIALTMYAANLLLLLLGGRVLGKVFVLRTIFGATSLSVAIGLMEGYFIAHPPLIASSSVSMLIGSVLMGFGIGVYYSHHGTCGGTDIVAAILSKKTTMSMGRVMMIVDVTIVALSFFLPFDGDWEARIQVRTQTIIYGWISICVYSLLADKYLSDGRQTMQLFIISDKWEEIAYRITHETGRGVTLWDAHGYWTGEKRIMMMVWCRRHDMMMMNKIISEVDNTAYLTINYVRSVFGNGFDPMKLPKTLSNKKQ